MEGSEKIGRSRREPTEDSTNQIAPPSRRRQGWRRFFRHPRLVIPCQVASQQSPTLFHQAPLVYASLKATGTRSRIGSGIPAVPEVHARRDRQTRWTTVRRRD